MAFAFSFIKGSFSENYGFFQSTKGKSMEREVTFFPKSVIAQIVMFYCLRGRNYDVIVNCMGKSEFSALVFDSQINQPPKQPAPSVHCIKVRAPNIKFAMVTDDFFIQPGIYIYLLQTSAPLNHTTSSVCKPLYILLTQPWTTLFSEQ